jgi:hypothetical protein
MPPKRWSSADFDVVIARVTPDIVALLGDGCAPLQDRDRRGPRRPAPEGRRPTHADAPRRHRAAGRDRQQVHLAGGRGGVGRSRAAAGGVRLRLERGRIAASTTTDGIRAGHCGRPGGPGPSLRSVENGLRLQSKFRVLAKARRRRVPTRALVWPERGTDRLWLNPWEQRVLEPDERSACRSG